MIVVTATLLFMMLLFAPIYLKAEVVLYIEKLSAYISVKFGILRVFGEEIDLAGSKLHCEGTVNADVEIKTIDRKSSVDLLKCITVEKLYLSVLNNIAKLNIRYAIAQNTLLALATATACNLFHCQFFSECIGTTGEDRICAKTLINFSVAELSFCLLKQWVRKWKICRSKK